MAVLKNLSVSYEYRQTLRLKYGQNVRMEYLNRRAHAAVMHIFDYLNFFGGRNYFQCLQLS